MFVVFEGIDGSGKTTISKIISEKLEWQYYRTPPIPFENIRTEIDKSCNPHSRFLFYLSSVCYASDEIKKLLRINSVVCDRYLYSTLAYHYALENSLRNIDLSNLDILRPDIIFYLNAKFQTRKKRIEKRALGVDSSFDHGLAMNESFQDAVESEYKKIPDLQIIDTEYLSLSGVVDECWNVISQRGAAC
jgi:thymidylate kinase